jgi:hypothetical protein
MYGMIHRCIVEFTNLRLRDRNPANPQIWSVDPGLQISASPYADAQTLGLVASAAETLNLSLPDFMFELGQYWIKFADDGPYGALMRFSGGDLGSFLRNLDHMHECVKTAMPGTTTPYFAVELERPDRIRVRYQSGRSGLDDFVRGLLQGLMTRFSVVGSVVMRQPVEGDPLFDLIIASPDNG